MAPLLVANGRAQSADDTWPMPSHDAANTGHASGVKLPQSKPEIAWQETISDDTYDDWGQNVYVSGDTAITVDPNRNVRGIDLESRELWTYPIGGDDRYLLAPAIVDDTVYVTDADREVLHAIDASSGNEQWTKASGAIGYITYANNQLYVGSGDGLQTYSLDGELLAGVDLPPIASPPTVVDGVVYTTPIEEEVAFALDADSLDPLWEEGKDIPSVVSPPLVLDDRLYCFSDLVEGTAVLSLDGDLLDLRNDTFGFPSTDGEVFYVHEALLDTELNNALVRYDPREQRIDWEFNPPDGQRLFHLGVAAGMVCVSDDEGTIYALDQESGQARWTIPGPGGGTSNGVLAYDGLYVNTVEAELQRIAGDSEDDTEADPPAITDVRLTRYAVTEDGDQPQALVDAENATRVEAIVDGTAIDLTDAGGDSWIGALPLPAEASFGDWVDVSIRASRGPATETTEQFETDYQQEKAAIGFHVVEDVRDVAVVLGTFENSSVEMSQGDIRELHHARRQDLNYFFGSHRGTMGRIGFDVTLIQPEDSDGRFFRVDARNTYTNQDPDPAIEAFLTDLQEAASDAVSFEEYDVWAGTHEGETIGGETNGKYDPEGVRPDVGRVYAPKSNTHEAEGYDTWVHELAHAVGLEHLYEHGLDQDCCVMGRGVREDLDVSSPVKPVPPLSSPLRIANTLGLDLSTVYGFEGPVSADDWLESTEVPLDDVESLTTESIPALHSYDPWADEPRQSVTRFTADGWVPSGDLTEDETEEGEEPDDQAIEVTTRQASEIGLNSAYFEGRITDDDLDLDEATVEGYFEYRKTGSANWTETPRESQAGIGFIGHDVTGLEADTEYEYRAVVEADGETGRGGIQRFVTDGEVDVELSYIPEYRPELEKLGHEALLDESSWVNDRGDPGAVIIYKHARNRRWGPVDIPDQHALNVVANQTADDETVRTLSPDNGELRDFLTPDQERQLVFRYEEAANGACEVTVEEVVPSGQCMAVDTTVSLPSEIEIPILEGPIEMPSASLVAQDESGRRVGRNMDGEYVVDIPGARTSGPRQGMEWILLPEDADVEFYVQNTEIDEFVDSLERQGSIDETDRERVREETTLNYHVAHTAYDPDAELVEIDGRTRVSDATTVETAGELDTTTQKQVQVDDTGIELVETEDAVTDDNGEVSEDTTPVELIAAGGVAAAGILYLAARMLSDNSVDN